MSFGFTSDTSKVFGKMVEEAGSYNVKIMDSSVAKKSKTGKEMAVLDYEVLDGKYAGGSIKWHNIVWDESSEEAMQLSLKRFNTLTAALGFPDGTNFNMTLERFVEGIKGKQLNINVDWEEGNNGNYHLAVKSQQELKEKSEPNGKFRPTSNSGTSATKASSNPFGNTTQSKQTTSNPFEQTTLENTDPFAKNSTTIDIPDKDLPF